MEEKIQTKEAGHWYKPDGSPAYTYLNKKGEEKNTTLREARKEGWFPSVTAIIDLQMKWALVNWKIDQAILSSLTLTRKEGEPEADYLLRIKEDAKEQAAKAAERGKLIHAAVQNGFEGKPFDVDGTSKFFESAKAIIEKECGKQDWVCEQPFASSLGYGGKVDLRSDAFIIDFKTTEKDLSTIKTWDDHAQQLGAYRVDGKQKCGILYINVLTAESKLIWIPEEELQQGFECFKALLAFWKAKNKIKE